MKKADWKKMDIKDVSAALSEHLRSKGIQATLVGGACVTVYSRNKYESLDIDFVSKNPNKQISEALAEIGFLPTTGRHFDHKECRYFVEFLAPPVAVGTEEITVFEKVETPFGVLHLLSPTDCVKDRLAAYTHWKDYESFNQAILVASSHRIGWKALETWAARENATEAFKELKKAYCNAVKVKNGPH